MNRQDWKRARDAFHAHLDGCAWCQNQPFNLCPRGHALLLATVDVAPVGEADAAPSAPAPVLTREETP
jgi:hypothetical protein